MRAVIKVIGTQGVPDGEDDVIELTTDGIYSRTETGFVLRYQESEITGLVGTTTTVEIEPDAITVERKGTLNSRMEFRENAKNSFVYDTQYGAATLGVETRRIKANFDDFGGDLCIDYIVNMEHAVVCKNKLEISVKTRR